MVEEWVKNAHGEARAALDARSEVEVELGAIKENHAKMAEQLKKTARARDSAEAGLKTTEKQFEEEDIVISEAEEEAGEYCRVFLLTSG